MPSQVLSVLVSVSVLTAAGCCRSGAQQQPTTQDAGSSDSLTILSEAQLLDRVRALPQVQALLPEAGVEVERRPGDPCKPTYASVCPAANEYSITVRTSSDPENTDPTLRFFVPPSGSTIAVDGSVWTGTQVGRLDYEVWQKYIAGKDTAERVTLELPEVVLYRLHHRNSKDKKTAFAIWAEGAPEAGCRLGQAACVFDISVGEYREGSYVPRAHWITVGVDPWKEQVGVTVFGAREPIAYDEWKKNPTLPSSEEWKRLQRPFPRVTPGQGPLGYGPPERTGVDKRTSDSLREVLSRVGYELRSTEQYERGTYTAVYAARIDRRPALSEQAASQPWGVRRLAHGIFAALQVGWPFELVDVSSDSIERYRYRGADKTFERLEGERWTALPIGK